MWISQMSQAKCSTLEFIQWVDVSLNRKFAFIGNKSDFNSCIARVDMTGLLYECTLTSTTLEDLYRNGNQIEQ